MQTLNVPAGFTVRLVATGRPDRDLHRWNVEVTPAAGGATRQRFGSWIGGRDVHQSVDIPPQEVDCRLEIQSRHLSPDGWSADLAAAEPTPNGLRVGFHDPSCPGARPDDVLLSFALESQREDAHGCGLEQIKSGSTQVKEAQGQAGSGRPLVPGARHESRVA